MGQLNYLSCIQFVDAVIGNSSSGLIEVPSFNKPTINIGDRQMGRIKSNTVIQCDPNQKSISNAIEIALSKKFKLVLKNSTNPYDNGNSSEKIVKTLKNISLKNIIKKNFFNINIK